MDAGDRLDGDLPGADPRRGYHAAAAAAPGALDALRAVSYGPSPALAMAATASAACSPHGRDLAVASGQDSGLDPSLVDACHKVIAP